MTLLGKVLAPPYDKLLLEAGVLILKLQEGYVQLVMSVTAVGKSTYPADRRADTAGRQSLSSGFCVTCVWLAARLTYGWPLASVLLAELGVGRLR